jgi:hypothetical protein
MDRENEMINNRVLFDMAMLETPAAPSNSVIPSNTTGNNEVAQEMLALKAHIKAQDRKIAKMEAMINQQAATIPHPEHPKSTKNDTRSLTRQTPHPRQQQLLPLWLSMAKLEEKFDKMINALAFMNSKMDTVMEDCTKRDHNNLSKAASSINQVSKKPDNKSPVKKKRPSLRKADESQSP